MNLEKIEAAFALVIENINHLQNQLNTDFYEAFVEQNAYYLGAENPAELVKSNNDKLRSSNLTAAEWQKVFQYVLIKGAKDAPMQANHNLTPDSIGFLFNFMIEQLQKSDELRVLEIGSGTGNLTETLLVYLRKKIDYVGFEVDDLLLDIAASCSEIIGTNANFMQIDGVQKQVLEPFDAIVSDLPVGFYGDDETAKHFTVASKAEHTYAHHLLMEQSFKYLKNDGFAIFLAPENLLTSAQSDFLKEWLKKEASLMAVITLPASMFKASPKAIFVLKKGAASAPTFVYPLSDLTDRQALANFMSEFTKSVKL